MSNRIAQWKYRCAIRNLPFASFNYISLGVMKSVMGPHPPLSTLSGRTGHLPQRHGACHVTTMLAQQGPAHQDDNDRSTTTPLGIVAAHGPLPNTSTMMAASGPKSPPTMAALPQKAKGKRKGGQGQVSARPLPALLLTTLPHDTTNELR